MKSAVLLSFILGLTILFARILDGEELESSMNGASMRIVVYFVEIVTIFSYSLELFCLADREAETVSRTTSYFASGIENRAGCSSLAGKISRSVFNPGARNCRTATVMFGTQPSFISAKRPLDQGSLYLARIF